MASILVIGGSGYIGSHMVARLLTTDHPTWILDNFSTGKKKLLLTDNFIEGDYGDATLLDEIFTQHSIDAVMHFAANSIVGESVTTPDKYYQNNVTKTFTLLNSMRKHQINYFIFSSTAAIFGEPQYTPIDEEHPKHPLNPYGRSKWMIEQILADYDQAYGIKSVCLRYFNAAGAEPLARIGECHTPETHLIPIILQTVRGHHSAVTVFGDDYATPDGSCIRDYIHVSDLADAHLLALEYLLQQNTSQVFNLGNGNGFSVYEIIAAAKQVTGHDFPVKIGARRAGDPARLIANADKASQLLNWQPQYSELTTIIKHAWQWEQKQN